MKIRLLFCLLILFALGISKASATNRTWLGGTTNFNTAANWAPAGTPTSSDALTITLTGVLNQPTISTAAVCQSLTINGLATTLTLNSTLTVYGSITLSTNTTISGTGSILSSGTVNLSVGGITFSDACSTTISGASTFASGSALVTSTALFTTSTAAFTGSTVTLGSGGMKITATSSTALTFTSGITNFNGTGTTTLSSGGGSAALSAGFVTIGSPITVTSGSLSMAAGTELIANASIGAGGALNINGSSTITGTSSVTATSLVYSGAYTLTGGTAIQINGALTPSNGNVNTFTFNNTLGITTPTLNITGGTTIGASNATTSEIYTATSAGTVTINGTINLNANCTFSVGTNVTMNLTSGNFAQGNGGTSFINAGALTTTTFPILCNSNGGGGQTYNNSGTLTANSNIEFDYGGFTNSGTITVQNASTFTVTSNSGDTFTNTGTININPNSAGTANSSFTFPGSGLTFNNTYVSSSFPGIINVTGITGNTTTLFSIAANGGPINNTGSIYAVNAPIVWTSANFTVINNTASSSPGIISLTNSPFTVGYAVTFNNSGSFSALSGSTVTLGTQSQAVPFNNSGTFILTGSTLNYPPQATFNNTGTFTASGSANIVLGSAGGTGIKLTNSGVFNAGIANSPCFITTGTSAQVTVSNTGTFNLGSTSSFTLTNTGTGSPCKVSNTSPGVFTLESDEYGSASIGISGTPTGTGTTNINQFTGNYNVQRYLAPGTAGYRLLSSPVNINTVTNGVGGNMGLSYVNSSATVVNPNAHVGTVTYNGALTGGPTGGGFSTYGCCGNPTMYLYEESKTTNNTTYTGGKDIGIAAIGNASSSTPYAIATLTGTITSAQTILIPAGNGFLMYYIGTDTLSGYSGSTITTGTTLTAIGTLNQQSITYSCWNAGNTGFPATGLLSDASTVPYNLVGNPYPSEIDLKKVYTDNPTSANSTSGGWTTFSQLDDLTQGYVTYNAATAGTSSPTTYRYIASGQGFFVLATGASQKLVFNEDQKVASSLNSSSTPPIFLSLKNQGNIAASPTPKTDALVDAEDVLTGLHLEMIQDSTHYDYCGIYFNSKWSDKYDNLDAYDQDGVSPSVYMSSFTSDNIRTSINSLGDYTKGKRIKLYVRAIKDGIYHLSMTDFQNIDTALFSIYLIDNQKNDSLDMVHYKTYNFNLTAADTAAFHNRFVLAIERKAMPLYSLVTFTGQKANSAIQLNWKTSGEGNYTGFGLEKLGANGQYALIDSAQSNGIGLYTYNDPNPVAGSNIYRLAQNDINGKVTFAGPININYNAISASGAFTIYPNPSKDIINVAVNSGTTGNAVIQTYLANIYSLGGTLINTRQLNTNNFTQDITAYKPGVYILELKTTDGYVIGKAKFVKTN